MQRHHKWIFSVLLVIIIIAFVFTIGAMPTGRADGSIKTDKFFGVNLRSQGALQPYEVDISFLLSLTQQRAPDRETYQGLIYDRIALDHSANAVNFPGPSQAEFMNFVTSLPVFLKQDGTFDKVRFQNFLDEMESNPRLKKDDVERAISNNARAFLFTDIESGPGYVFPAEAKLVLVQRNAEYVLETAAIDLSKIDTKVAADPAALKAFYETHKNAYRVPAKVETDLLVFPVEKYTPAAPSDADVEAFYIRNQKRWPNTTFAVVKEKVKAEYIRALARRAAVQAAVDFALAAQNAKIAVGSPEWQALLKKEGISPKSLPAFGAGETLAEISVSAEGLAEIANQLSKTEERVFSEPVAANEGALIFVRKALVPSHIPEFAEVAAKVSADYTAYTQQQRVSEKEREILAALRKAVAEGKSFAQAAAAQKGLLQAVKKTASFTIVNPPQDVPGMVLYAVQDTIQGDMRLVPMRNQDPVIVYVAQKKLPEIAKDNPELKALTAQLALMSARATQAAVQQQRVYEELVRVGEINPSAATQAAQ